LEAGLECVRQSGISLLASSVGTERGMASPAQVHSSRRCCIQVVSGIVTLNP